MSATTYTPSAAAGIPTVDESTLPGRTAGIRRTGLLVGVAGLVAWAALALLYPTVLRAYLVAYIFFVGLSVGSLGLMMLHHLVGGEQRQRPLDEINVHTGQKPWRRRLDLTFFGHRENEYISISTICQ